MIKLLVLLLALFCNSMCQAQKPPGFLWYNLPKEEKPLKKNRPKGVPFRQLSFQQQDAVMAYYTREAWHKAMNQLTVPTMRDYIALQDFWTQRATKTSRLFEKTMLYYPQYHYEASHPSNSIGVKVADEQRVRKEQIVIRNVAKNNGLLYFYRGKNPYDQKQGAIIADFSKRYGLHLLPVSVDGVLDPLFPESRRDSGQAQRLAIRFFPALILINPKTKQTRPVSYGLITQDMLARQFVLVATDFAKGDL